MSPIPQYTTAHPFRWNTFTLESGLLILKNTDDSAAIIVLQDAIQCNGHEENVLSVRLPHNEAAQPHTILCACDDCCRRNGLNLIQLAKTHSREFEGMLELHKPDIRVQYNWVREHLPTILDQVLTQLGITHAWLFDINQALTNIATKTTWLDEWQQKDFPHLTVQFHHFNNQFPVIGRHQQ